MSKVTLKVEIEKNTYRELRESFLFIKTTLATEAVEAIKTATPITESDDCVSRQAVIAEIKNLYPDIPSVDFNNARLKWTRKYKPYLDCEEVVKSMPPVLPKRKQGEWRQNGTGYNDTPIYECSQCGKGVEFGSDGSFKSCPYCGAEMR